MSRSRSIASRYGSAAANGVSGLSVSPTRQAPVVDRRGELGRVADLGVDGHEVRAGPGEAVEQVTRVRHHQVAVEERRAVTAQ